jgi:hypothetical protein
MTFNIFIKAPTQEVAEENLWENRADRVIASVKSHDPDLLSVVECNNEKLAALADALPDYDSCLINKSGELGNGELPGFFYKTSVFEEVVCDAYWLSKTPFEPETFFEGATSGHVVHIRLKELETGRSLSAYTTHWPYANTDLFDLMPPVMRDVMGQWSGDEPILLAGDFNADENNTAILALLDGDPDEHTQLIDAYAETGNTDAGTFNGWGENPSDRRIDFIFHNRDLKALEAMIDTTTYPLNGGEYPSDHWPVIARIEWPR